MKVYNRCMFLFVFASIKSLIAAVVFIYVNIPWVALLFIVLTMIFMIKSLLVHAEVNAHSAQCVVDRIFVDNQFPQTIDTAPKDGTVIMGWWKGDEDPRPCEVYYSVAHNCWMIDSGNAGIQFVVPPTHWSPTK